jgi:DNA modification methylase
LPEWFIKLFTQENDIVLDPFMGAGITNIVAQRMNRNSIGIEILPEYFEIVNKIINSKKLTPLDKNIFNYENIEYSKSYAIR